MNIVPNWFKNISITRKLYFVVGLMATLIVFELFTLVFAVRTLSSVRAYIAGEGLWSKAQKDAIYYLQKYGHSHSEDDYEKFLVFTKVPLGDHKTLVELQKKQIDMDVARQGFIEGRNHPDDVDGMIKVFQRFGRISYIAKAMTIWAEADPVFAQLLPIGKRLHTEINSKRVSQKEIIGILKEIDPINEKLTILEDEFSYTLGEGARWLENLILKILFIIVATVECTGLFLTISVSFAISKGIGEIIRVSSKVAKADFSDRATIYSTDEIGQLAASFNQMADELEKLINEKNREEGKFRALLESAPDAMVIVNHTGKIQLVNAQAENIFGYKRESMIGQEIEFLIPNRYHHKHHAHTENFFAQPKARAMGAGLELYGKKYDGTEFAVEVSLSPLETEDELLVSAAIRDVSEKKKISLELQDYAARLEQSNIELEQFAYVASHDLKEPLRTVNSFVQLLHGRYANKLDNDANEFINYTVDGVKRMDQLINDLLTYSRVSSQNQKYEEVNCSSVIETILKSLQGVIQLKNAEITYDPLPILMASKIQITQLFQNLINNAIKFHGKDNPKIHISAQEQEKEWLFSVSDNGIGIDKQYSDKIFTIFQRLHSRSKYEGTGIGLAICKKIIQQYRGKIWVESELDKGSTFYFTFRKQGVWVINNNK